MIVVSGRVRIDNLAENPNANGRAILRHRCVAVRSLFARASHQSRQRRDVRRLGGVREPADRCLLRRVGVSPGGGQAEVPPHDVVARSQPLICHRAYRHIGRPAWAGDRELRRKSAVGGGSWGGNRSRSDVYHRRRGPCGDRGLVTAVRASARDQGRRELRRQSGRREARPGRARTSTSG